MAARSDAAADGRPTVRGRHLRPARQLRIAVTLACSTVGATTALVGTASSPAAALTMGEQAVLYAAEEAGDPYVWGAGGPNSFDCSGLTSYVYRRLGVNLPHQSTLQYNAVPHVAQGDKQPGDLIFAHSGGSIYHVGIYAGNDQMWAAPQSGDVVKLSTIWTSSYYVGRPWTGPAPLSRDNQAIVDKHGALGGDAGLLGPATGPYATIPGRGAYIGYAGGAITSDGNGGSVHETHGPIRERWAALGFENSPLGLPTSDVTPSSDGVGSYSNFQGGAISHSPESGAHATYGPIRERWLSAGAEFGALGYPTSDVHGSGDGVGTWTNFQNGAISWSPASGAQETHGPIRERWLTGGAEFGPLGYPTSGVHPSTDGRGTYSNFQGGAISWSPTTGAHATSGAIRAFWGSTGLEFGPLGYPTAEQVTVKPGVIQQRFAGGTVRHNTTTGKIVQLEP